ncbi:hypothetical protein K1719_011328 [Acacia pycnantha]|nr:hypothetical protein K1719_011328 [Acacia pycnantha]
MLISVNVQGSTGPIRFVVSKDRCSGTDPPILIAVVGDLAYHSWTDLLTTLLYSKLFSFLWHFECCRLCKIAEAIKD